MKKEAHNRQLAMVGLCVGWKVYKAGWEVCCWKVCWWQLAMAGLCGVVEWGAPIILAMALRRGGNGL